MPDVKPDPETLACLPTLPKDESGPVFAGPWQAQAFAIAVRLSNEGHFTWTEWAAALADELKAVADRGALDERKEAWADAYRHTPHGKPVELRR